MTWKGAQQRPRVTKSRKPLDNIDYSYRFIVFPVLCFEKYHPNKRVSHPRLQ